MAHRLIISCAYQGSGPDHGRVEFLVEDRACLPAPAAAARHPIRLRLRSGDHSKTQRSSGDRACGNRQGSCRPRLRHAMQHSNYLDDDLRERFQLPSYAATVCLHRRPCFPSRPGRLFCQNGKAWQNKTHLLSMIVSLVRVREANHQEQQRDNPSPASRHGRPSSSAAFPSFFSPANQVVAIGGFKSPM